MSWSKLQFSFDDDPVNSGFRITSLVQQRDEELGRPAGFAVYTGIRHGEDAKSTYNEVYFTPVATSCCVDILASWGAVECGEPKASELQHFGLSYGNPTLKDLLR